MNYTNPSLFINTENLLHQSLISGLLVTSVLWISFKIYQKNKTMLRPHVTAQILFLGKQTELTLIILSVFEVDTGLAVLTRMLVTLTELEATGLLEFCHISAWLNAGSSLSLHVVKIIQQGEVGLREWKSFI